MPNTKPTQPQTLRAAIAVANALGTSVEYAVVGGGACSLLGSHRLTEDLDFVVPKGDTKKARDALKKRTQEFDVDKKTLHTLFKSSPDIEIEILTPPALFREQYDKSTPTIMVGTVRVLKPALILNSKCGSIYGRATQEKKNTDAMDIRFLLRWFYKNQVQPTAADVPNANGSFVSWFISEFGGQQDWINAWYDLDNGRFIG